MSEYGKFVFGWVLLISVICVGLICVVGSVEGKTKKIRGIYMSVLVMMMYLFIYIVNTI